MVTKNSFNCIGRLTADPEVFETNGVKRAEFSLAVEKSDSNNSEKGNVNFFDFIAWRGVAEYIENNFHKGDLIEVVDAYANVREFVDNEGNKRRKTEYQINRAYMLSKKRSFSESE